MNVYVRETARELCRMGAHVDVFTRSQNSAHPARRGDGARGARHPPPGGARGARCRARTVHAHLDEFVAGVERVPARAGTRVRPDPRALLALRRGRARPARAWDAPLVQMFHTLGRLKNTVAQTAAEVEPELRIAEESRIVARGRPHRRRQRGGARASRLVLRRARRARRRSSRAASTPSCSSRWAARRPRTCSSSGPSRCCSTSGDCSRSRDSRRCSTRWCALPEAHAAHHRRRPGRARQWTRRRAARAGQSARPRAARPLPRRPAAAAAPALLRGGRRHRDAVVLRVLRHGGARGDGLRQPRGRLARGRAHDDDPGRRHRPPRAGGRSRSRWRTVWPPPRR